MLQAFAFILFTVGIFYILKITPHQIVVFFAEIISRKKKVNIQTAIKNSINKKELRGIKKLIHETQEILVLTNKTETFTQLVMAAIGLFVGGMIFCLAIGNLFLIPVLAVGLSLIPFWYVSYTYNFWRKQLNAELETALSIITTSYLRCNNFVLAVEENKMYLNTPIFEIFSKFLIQTKLVSSNFEKSILNLKGNINNAIWEEWCDALIACQTDSSLKVTLLPIVKKLSDMRMVGLELNNMLYAPIKEVATMAVLVITAPYLIYCLNSDWYIGLTQSTPGKIVISITVAVLFLTISSIIKNTRPVEYRR